MTGLPPRGARRTPRADVDGTGLLVPALVLRVGVLAVGALLVVLLTDGRPTGWLTPALAVLVTVAALVPNGLVVGLLGLVGVVVQLGYGALDARAVATAVALHLVWRLCALASLVPASARVELAALRPAALRSGAVVAFTVVVAALVGGARAGGVRVGEQLLLLAGVVLLAGGAAVAVLVWGGRDRG